MNKYSPIDAYSRVLDINDSINVSCCMFYMKFNDTKMENNYQDFIVINFKKIKAIVNLLFLIFMIIRFFIDKMISSFCTVFYLDLVICIFYAIIYIINNFFIKNLKWNKILNFGLSFLLSLSNAFNSIFTIIH